MAKEISTVSTTGRVLYAVILNGAGQFWYTVGSAFEAYNASHWASYAIALTEQGASGIYLGDFPAAAFGEYRVAIFVRVGGASAVGDTALATGTLRWTGAAEAPYVLADASGRVDVGKVFGTAQTAGDLIAGQNTIASYIDTEVAAIKARTDLIPNSPAAVGSPMTLGTDAVSAAALASDAVAELVAAIFGQVSTEGYAADGVAPTFAQWMYMVWAMLGEKAISGTTLTARKLDGSTPAMTFALDSGAAPTSITRAT